jgi:hypothetical protein
MQCACAILLTVAWPAVQYFSTLSHKVTIFEKKIKVIEHKSFCFPLKHLSETFLILRGNVQDMIKKCVYVFMYSTCYSGTILMKLVLPRQFVEKYSNIKFHENPSSGRRVPCGHIDGRTDTAKLIVAFRNSTIYLPLYIVVNASTYNDRNV